MLQPLNVYALSYPTLSLEDFQYHPIILDSDTDSDSYYTANNSPSESDLEDLQPPNNSIQPQSNELQYTLPALLTTVYSYLYNLIF